jgi:hypothetical protein
MKLFLDQYADINVLANYEFSSEQTSFPGVNVLNNNRRSKVWRSNGYWNITSLNNTFIFRDVNAGADKIAVVPVFEYHSTAAFVIALKTAMDLVGSNVYTVTYNAQNKFVIASSGAYFELRNADVLSTLAGVIGFDTALHATGFTTYTADVLSLNTGSEWIMFDLGLPSFPNAFAMTDERNRPLKFSPSASFTLSGNFTDPIDWSSAAFIQSLTYDPEVIMQMVPADGNFYASALRYWRIDIADQNALGYVQLGSVFLGRYFAPTRCPQFPFENGMVDRSITTFSEGGQSFSDILPQTESFKVNYKNLTTADVEFIRYYFNIYGTAKPFFVVFDDTVAFSSAIERKTRLVKFDNEPSFSLESFENWSCNMSFREEL